MSDDFKTITEGFKQVTDALRNTVIGHTTVIRDLFICILCGGHALIEGVPGLGKTLLVRSLGSVLDLKYSRIQCTPDLMPADILGTNIIKQDEKGNNVFEFYKGPVFGQIVLADEINRTTPKTQSALLEAMQEEAVTIFGRRYPMERPFIVIATQNPIEMEGTYPLPEAQIDRFFFKLTVRYPSFEELSTIIDTTTCNTVVQPTKVLDGPTIAVMKTLVKEVPVASHVKEYAIRLVLAAHPSGADAPESVRKNVLYGPSVRGIQSLILAGKVLAILDGRYSVAIDDIQSAAKPALRHRLLLNLKGQTAAMDTDVLIDELLAKVSTRPDAK